MRLIPSFVGLFLALAAILWMNKRQAYIEWRDAFRLSIANNPAAWEWRRKQMIKEEMST